MNLSRNVVTYLHIDDRGHRLMQLPRELRVGDDVNAHMWQISKGNVQKKYKRELLSIVARLCNDEQHDFQSTYI